MPPSAKDSKRRKTYKGTASDKNPPRAKPYSRPNKSAGSLPGKPRPAAAGRTASKLAALGLSSIGAPVTGAEIITPAPRAPTKSQQISQKMKDEDLLDSLDAELGTVVAALNERCAEKSQGKANKLRKKQEAKLNAELKQQEYEKLEEDFDATLGLMKTL